MKNSFFLVASFTAALILAGAMFTGANAQTTSTASNQLCPTGGYTCPGTSSPVTSFGRDLYVGTAGTDVLALQQLLNRQELFYGPFFGEFGPVTKAALVNFQKRYDIQPASGYFGPRTRALANYLLSL